jgi:hypothetical protein
VQSPKTLRQIIIEQLPGSWIAISRNQKWVVGSGLSSEDARLAAKANGYPEVILLRIPQRDSIEICAD